MEKTTRLPPPVERYIQTTNSGDADGFISTFAVDAVVKDVEREIRGLEAIRVWANHDIFGVKARFDVMNVVARDGQTIVTVKINGTFDRTGLPDPLIMDHFFEVGGGKIVALTVRFAPARE